MISPELATFNTKCRTTTNERRCDARWMMLMQIASTMGDEMKRAALLINGTRRATGAYITPLGLTTEKFVMSVQVMRVAHLEVILHEDATRGTMYATDRCLLNNVKYKRSVYNALWNYFPADDVELPFVENTISYILLVSGSKSSIDDKSFEVPVSTIKGFHLINCRMMSVAKHWRYKST